MITYDRLWEILKEKEISKRSLMVHGGISASTIMRLNKNSSVNLTTIDALCNIIGCTPGDILCYTPTPMEEAGQLKTSTGDMEYSGEQITSVASDCGEGNLGSLPLNLQKGLRERGLTAAELSRASGVPRSSISNILSGRRSNPSFATVVALARGLGVSVETLAAEN